LIHLILYLWAVGDLDEYISSANDIGAT
jgi:hypothetical protein